MKSVLLLIGVAALTACAIQPDAQPRDIPVDDRIPLDPPAPDAGDAGDTEGPQRVFLLADADSDGEWLLRSVARTVTPQTADALLTELFKGPNPEEFAAGFESALPETLGLRTAIAVAGTLNVDMTEEILELPLARLQLAVAQIVFTASELDNVRLVRLRVMSQPQAWPNGRGEQQTEPLTVYDFPGFAESTQPPFPAIPSQPPA